MELVFVEWMQDGQIDYNEFVAMMHKGNAGGFVKKSLDNSISIRFSNALNNKHQ